MPDLRGETSSQESVFEDREKEFYRRLQNCHSKYYSSVTLREHSEEDVLVIFSLLIPELINLARFVEEKGDAESSNAENCSVSAKHGQRLDKVFSNILKCSTIGRGGIQH